MDDFERALATEARRRGLDGVVCGHIHKAALHEVDEIAYCNDGDWVESCTAACERHDGGIELVEWAKVRDWSMLDHRTVASGLELSAASERLLPMSA